MFLFLVLVLVLVFGGESVVRFNDSGGAFKSGRSGLAVYRPSRLGPETAGSMTKKRNMEYEQKTNYDHECERG